MISSYKIIEGILENSRFLDMISLKKILKNFTFPAAMFLEKSMISWHDDYLACKKSIVIGHDVLERKILKKSKIYLAEVLEKK